MPTNPETTRTMVLLDNETQVGLPGSCWLNPAQISLDTATRMLSILQGAGGAFALTATLTPAALGAGQTDDYNPGSLAAVARLRLSANAAGSQLSGLIASATDGQAIVITNISANDLTLLAENAGSAAANRFALNGDVILGANQSVTLLYDTGIARWTLL